MKKVLTYGTFDLLHLGHINLLKRAKGLGSHLTVGLSTDEFDSLKHKNSYYSFEHRKMILEAIRFVDAVIPEKSWDQKVKDVVSNNIDVFVMGDDWKGHFDYLQEFCEVIYLPRTVGVSTTKIKNELFSGTNG
ncbi:glycerol-3-phosphate cytidylyltransferase [Neobacillus sp. NPDC093127]|uniref:glycerol-3-phosphate cytidylyltransferase n=1 Tax=Neobacillus sp. NPDC093127 TaxID=3364296 RepID=UPI0038153DB4